MSPDTNGRPIYQSSGPRASGDEPLYFTRNDRIEWWSPRERG